MREATFLILTALADQPRHGYGIIQEVTVLSRRTGHAAPGNPLHRAGSAGRAGPGRAQPGRGHRRTAAPLLPTVQRRPQRARAPDRTAAPAGVGRRIPVARPAAQPHLTPDSRIPLREPLCIAGCCCPTPATTAGSGERKFSRRCATSRPRRRGPRVAANLVCHGLRARLGRPSSRSVVIWASIFTMACGLFAASFGTWLTWLGSRPLDHTELAAAVSPALPRRP